MKKQLAVAIFSVAFAGCGSESTNQSTDEVLGDEESQPPLTRLETPSENCRRLESEILELFGSPDELTIEGGRVFFAYSHGQYVVTRSETNCESNVPWDRDPIMLDAQGEPVESREGLPVYLGHSNVCNDDKDTIVAERGSAFTHAFRGGNQFISYETFHFSDDTIVGFHSHIVSNVPTCDVYFQAGLRLETPTEACERMAAAVVSAFGPPEQITETGSVKSYYYSPYIYSFDDSGEAFCDSNAPSAFINLPIVLLVSS